MLYLSKHHIVNSSTISSNYILLELWYRRIEYITQLYVHGFIDNIYMYMYICTLTFQPTQVPTNFQGSAGIRTSESKVLKIYQLVWAGQWVGLFVSSASVESHSVVQLKTTTSAVTVTMNRVITITFTQ